MHLHLQSYLQSLGISGSMDMDLLVQAFTHKSFSADSPSENIPFNERLEFLGDSILGAQVAHQLFELHPNTPESQLTLSKIYLVKEETLADIAREISLGQHIRLGNGEKRSGGGDKDSVLSDTLEALLAYIYLVHGEESVASFVKKYIMTQLDDLLSMPGKSWKSMLQEYVQKNRNELPTYEDREIEVEDNGNVLLYGTDIYVRGTCVAHGTGVSKKKAQEDGAQRALEVVSKQK